MLQFKGNPPIDVTRYKKETLRCNCCGYIVMAHQSIPKWTDSAKSTAILQRIIGMPMYSLARLQEMYGVPVSESTLWQLSKEAWEEVGKYVYKELEKTVATKCRNLHIDDSVP
jgi:hypothetical protein